MWVIESYATRLQIFNPSTSRVALGAELTHPLLVRFLLASLRKSRGDSAIMVFELALTRR